MPRVPREASEGRLPYRAYERQGFTILVGRGASDNDRLTFEVASPDDLWLHVSGWSGSHVLVRTAPDGAPPPRAVIEEAARLAAWHSKARGSRGKIEVHVCRAGDVHKPRGMAAGKVVLNRFDVVRVYATAPPEEDSPEPLRSER